MEFLEKKKDLYKDATQKEPRAKRALMDAFIEICELAQMIEKEVRDKDSFEAVFEKCLSKKSTLKKALNKLPETLSAAKKADDELTKLRKDVSKPMIGGAGAATREELNEIVGISGKPAAKRGRPKATAAAAAAEDPESPKRPHKAKITPTMREHAWKRYIGNLAETNCPVCDDNKIKMTNFTAGHIVAEACDGVTDKDNLMPICNTCNVRMATKHLYEYCRKEFGRDPVFPGSYGK